MSSRRTTPGTSARRVGYAEIAHALGLSNATVSRALTGHPEVSAATRQLVRQTARKLGYRPDPALAALAAHRWPGGRSSGDVTIAYVHPHGTRSTHDFTTREYIPLIRIGAIERCRQLGYQIEDFWINDFPDQRALSRVLYNRGIRGVIIAPVNHTQELKLTWRHFAHVFVGDDIRYPRLNTVSINWHDILDCAVTHAIDKGYRRIGFALFDHVSPHFDSSILAFTLLQQERLRSLGCAVLPRLHHSNRAEPAFARWMRRSRPDLVIASHILPFLWLEQEKVALPGDCGFICLSRFLGGSAGHVTSIDHLPEEQGHRAVDMVHQHLLFNRLGMPEYPAKGLAPFRWFEGATVR